MKVKGIMAVLFILLIVLCSFQQQQFEVDSLTIKVDQLRNTKGNVLFTLYNVDGSIPDEHYEKYYLQQTAEIVNHSSTVTFSNLPIGKYAVSVLHDEDKDGKIDKGWVLPIEGIGFSNFQSIGLANRPNFSNASFILTSDTTVMVKMVYM